MLAVCPSYPAGLLIVFAEARDPPIPPYYLATMKFAFDIFWIKNGSVERLLAATASFRSIETARMAAKNFASHFPVHSIDIEAEDGSVLERWFWSNADWTQQDEPARQVARNRPPTTSRCRTACRS